jgi:hypothetical protein
VQNREAVPAGFLRQRTGQPTLPCKPAIAGGPNRENPIKPGGLTDSCSEPVSDDISGLLGMAGEQSGILAEELLQRLGFPAGDHADSIGSLIAFLTLPEGLPEM